MSDREMYDLGKWDVPKENTACPSCGQQYGHHNTKVCMTCEECSKCCGCPKDKQKLLPASEAVPKILEKDM